MTFAFVIIIGANVRHVSFPVSPFLKHSICEHQLVKSKMCCPTIRREAGTENCLRHRRKFGIRSQKKSLLKNVKYIPLVMSND